jgi:hypothetical protein
VLKREMKIQIGITVQERDPTEGRKIMERNLGVVRRCRRYMERPGCRTTHVKWKHLRRKKKGVQ